MKGVYRKYFACQLIKKNISCIFFFDKPYYPKNFVVFSFRRHILASGGMLDATYHCKTKYREK